MAYSLQEVPSDGTLALLSVSLEYFDRSEIKVYFDDVEDALPWAWVGTTDKLISFDPPVPDGTVVLVKRISDLADIRHSLTGGAQFTDEVMDENFTQVLRIAQEAVEQTGQGAIDIAQNALDVANSVIGVADAATEFATEALETAEDAENIALAAADTANGIAGTANAAFAAASNAEDVALAAEAAVAGKVDTTDPRLSDTRDPNPHNHAISDVTGLQTALDGKQDTLISGTNIKTINGGSVLGSGNITIAPAASFRNKIINGKMEIAQRGTSFAAIASGAYSLDRWTCGNTSTAVLTASQQSDVPSSNELQSSLRFAVTTADTSIAAGDLFTVVQLVEGFNVRDLIGRTFTLSFWVRSSKTGTHCIAIRNSGNDRSYIAEYTISAANTWEFKTITVSGGLITAGTWDWTNGVGIRVIWALAAGSTLQTTANAWQTGSFLATSNQVNCLDTIGNIFAITGVQLEVGSVATPFEHRPYGTELALCQRYYYKVSNYELSSARNASNAFAPTVQYPVTMRATPTLDSGASFTVSTGSAGVPAYQSGPGSTPTVDRAGIYNSSGNWTVDAWISINAGFAAEL